MTNEDKEDYTIDLGNHKQYEVTLDFSDPTELSKILHWFYNSGEFAIIYMTDEVIEKARRAGLKVTIKEKGQ